MKYLWSLVLVAAACGSPPPPAAPAAPANVAAPPAPEPAPEPEPALAPEPVPEPEPAPASAPRTALIPSGSGVRIVGIGPDDAYVNDRAKIVGLVCTADGDLDSSDGVHHSGSLKCVDGQTYYFYQVRLLAAAAPSYGSTIPEGSTFTITGLSAEDAFYEDAPALVNLQCTATSPLTETGTGFYGGDARCSDGEDYTFYQVAIGSVTTP